MKLNKCHFFAKEIHFILVELGPNFLFEQKIFLLWDKLLPVYNMASSGLQKMFISIRKFIIWVMSQQDWHQTTTF